MFYFLHRIYVLGWVSFVIGGIVWLYPRTGVSELLSDWYAVWQNKPAPTTRPVGELSGTVVKVLDGVSLTLHATDGRFYNIGLLGIVPPPVRNAPEQRAAELSKARLKELILSNEVRVTLTWLDPQRRGVGIIYAQDTNVNAAMVESGLVKLKPEFIRNVRWRDQYAMLRADRRARFKEGVPGE